MSEKIADWLIEQKAISTGERELYAYAVHCLFSLLYPIAFASVIGAFLGMPIEAVVMIMSFIAVRKFSGRDDHVIGTCDKYNMAMAFTGIRLFHH